MSGADLFAELSEGVLKSIVAGASVPDAARHVGCAPRTVQRWLARGRENPQGRYGLFAERVDAIQRERELPRELPLDEEELKRVVARAARKGNVQAMRLAWELIVREPSATDDPFDDLARQEP